MKDEPYKDCNRQPESLRSDLFHEEVVLSGTLVHFELQHGDVRDDAARRHERRCDVKAS